MTDKTYTNKTYKIIVACGTGIATSTYVAIKIKELLKERGIEVSTIQCRVTEVVSYAHDADLVVSTAQVPFDINIPVISGVPFLTGKGVEEVIDRIQKILLEKQQ